MCRRVALVGAVIAAALLVPIPTSLGGSQGKALLAAREDAKPAGRKLIQPNDDDVSASAALHAAEQQPATSSPPPAKPAVQQFPWDPLPNKTVVIFWGEVPYWGRLPPGLVFTDLANMHGFEYNAGE